MSMRERRPMRAARPSTRKSSWSDGGKEGGEESSRGERLREIHMLMSSHVQHVMIGHHASSRDENVLTNGKGRRPVRVRRGDHILYNQFFKSSSRSRSPYTARRKIENAQCHARVRGRGAAGQLRLLCSNCSVLAGAAVLRNYNARPAGEYWHGSAPSVISSVLAGVSALPPHCPT